MLFPGPPRGTSDPVCHYHLSLSLLMHKNTSVTCLRQQCVKKTKQQMLQMSFENYKKETEENAMTKTISVLTCNMNWIR